MKSKNKANRANHEQGKAKNHSDRSANRPAVINAALEQGLAYEKPSVLRYLKAYGSPGGEYLEDTLIEAISAKESVANVAAPLLPPQTQKSPRDFLLGHDAFTGEPLFVPPEDWLYGSVSVGATGSGKSTATFRKIEYAVQNGAFVECYDLRPAMVCCINRFPNFVCLHLNELVENLLEPPPGISFGGCMQFYSGWFDAFCRARSLPRPVAHNAIAICGRLLRGRQPNDPYPSPIDVANVAASIGEKNLARNLYLYCGEFGKAATIRKGVSLRDHCAGVVYILSGEHPLTVQGFLDFKLAYKLCETPTPKLPHFPFDTLVVIDEVQLVNSEIQRRYHKDYISPIDKLATQSRYRREAVVFSAQSCSEPSRNILANAQNVECFRQQHILDAGIMKSMLCLPETANAEIQTLPVGTCYAKSASWPTARLVQMPFLDMGPYPSPAQIKAAQSHLINT